MEKFLSILTDGSTDTGNIDDEMFLVLWCDVDHEDQNGPHQYELQYQSENRYRFRIRSFSLNAVLSPFRFRSFS